MSRLIIPKLLLSAPRCILPVLSRRFLNSNSGSITKVHRETFTRTYPTVLVLPDGSSIRIRYDEPRQIITLPVDLTLLTESERKARLERRKPKEKIKIEDDYDDDFDPTKYLNKK
ncbi:large ribosomal subunit protein mL55 [Neocloeon triangulifer]|uniref:large ribosomal subunit protein mL55 n=1 Tax=Neocloeon triangulifer TaxID=2078957 RepID=UPI00286F2AA0|nr:large ribosomal subunit protein mL55 [Neocloeon triangulifer]